MHLGARAPPAAPRDRPRPCAAPAGAARARSLRATRRRLRPARRRRAGPAATSFVTADFAPTIAPRPRCTWPVTPDCPAIITSSSSTVLPAMPTCAASSTLRPILTPCAIWTRLSIFVPGADARLADRRPIDRRVRADLHVVFDHDAADLRNLLVRAVRPPGEAEAVAADHGAVLHDHAVADHHVLADRHVGVDARSPRQSSRRRRSTTCGADHRARADARARADDDERRDRDVGAELGRRIDAGERADAGRHPRGRRRAARPRSANARYGWRRAQDRARRGRRPCRRR